MFRNNVPLKAAIGYGIVAVILFIAILLVYSNTKSVIAIGNTVKEYSNRQEKNDSAVAQLLANERENLKQLNDALDNSHQPGALHRKVKDLQKGADSVVVKPKTTKEHHVKKTTIEVEHTRKGFFRRFADLFRGSHADTVSIKRDSSLASVDTVAKRVDISSRVARILDDADKEEKEIARHRHEDVKKEMDDLKALNTYMTLQQTKKMEMLRQRDKKAIQQDMDKALKARQRLIIQIIILSVLAIVTAVILLWRIWHDTKREKEYREALENANAEIKRIMEQREQLLLTITHDIKSPAASITGFTDLLKDYIPSEKGQELLGNIHDSATHLSQLVASLLDYHQLENGLIKINQTDFSPADLASQCIMGMKQRADEKGLALHIDTSDCGDTVCRGDAFRIRQIIDNLLSNAVKYTDKGSVTLILDINNNNLIIKVKDTGKGIPEDEQLYIFQAFKRLGNAQGIEGTGLGLAIVSQLVSLLSGKISVKSEVGKGSTFTVTLPVSVITGAANEQSHSVDQQPHKANKLAKTFRNHELLILDDDPLQLKLLQEMVHQIAGDSWKVTACNHVIQALTYLHNTRPSLMIMDIEMPEMNGTDFISHIDHHDMTVIAMTAHDESIAPKLRDAGFDGCLFKPVKAKMLAEALGINFKAEEHSAPTNKAGAELLDDPQIMKAINKEIADFSQQLESAISGSQPNRRVIAGVAHKLAPLAKMLNLNCIEAIESLSPERIGELTDAEIVEAVNSCISTNGCISTK